MAMPIGRRSHGGHSSVRKNAIIRPTGTAISMAMTEVTTRAVDRRQRAEIVGDRIPSLADQEAEAEGPERRQRAADQRDDDAAEKQQHAERRRARHVAEGGVAEAQPIEHFGARGRLDGHDRFLLQCNVNHGSPPGRVHRSAPATEILRAPTQTTTGRRASLAARRTAGQRERGTLANSGASPDFMRRSRVRT